MKKLWLILVLLILGSSVTYAYLISQTRTDDMIFKIGTPDVQGVVFTQTSSSNLRLIPLGTTASTSNQVTHISFELRVDSTEHRNYNITHNLPTQFKVSNNSGGMMWTGTTYQITVQLLEPVDLTETTFYLYINFY